MLYLAPLSFMWDGRHQPGLESTGDSQRNAWTAPAVFDKPGLPKTRVGTATGNSNASMKQRLQRSPERGDMRGREATELEKDNATLNRLAILRLESMCHLGLLLL